MFASMLIGLSFFAVVPAEQPVNPVEPGKHVEYQPLAERSRRYARCIVARARQASIKLVLADSSESRSYLKMLKADIEQAMGGCSRSDGSLTLEISDLRGDLAEAFLTENGSALLHQAGVLPPVVPVRLMHVAEDVVDPVFDCAVAAQPADAVKMLAAAAGSPDEGAAFLAMGPALQACVPVDYELHIKPHLVRRLVAGALYRAVARRAEGPDNA